MIKTAEIRKLVCAFSGCDKEFDTRSKIRLYCSDLCRSRNTQEKHGKKAKEIACIGCKKPFFRVCARDNKCVACKEAVKAGETISALRNTDVVIRVLNNSESAMIKNFLKKRA